MSCENTFLIGCHLSLEGGYRSMGERILFVEGNTFQFFTKNPKGRVPVKTPEPEDVEALCAIIRENGMRPPLAHAPYTYNPCSKDEGVRSYSRDSMRRELEFLENIEGSLYNFHPGCHVGQGVEQGIVGEIEGHIARFRKKFDNLLIIFAGGEAKHFAKQIKKNSQKIK